ncbi:hypothetical protein [Leuconostoc citreum]
MLESQARSAQVNSNATNYVDTIVEFKVTFRYYSKIIGYGNYF